MKNKLLITVSMLLCLSFFGQNTTYSPYSRYALGELTPPTFAHNLGMGGANIALRPDTTMPVFINVGNPASYALIRFTSLEVGGNYFYSNFTGGQQSLKKWNTNFSYATIGFPIRNKGGAVLGIMPYSHLGYDLKSTQYDSSVGDSIKYLYSGTGGLTKAFLGYGVAPFNQRLIKFRKKYLYSPDSAHMVSKLNYKLRENISKLLSDFSIGANLNYVFGSLQNTTRTIYPNSLLYNNTYRVRSVSLGDFTGNFGIQTAFTIDTALDRPERKERVEKIIGQLAAGRKFSKEQLKAKRDSLFDAMPLKRKAMKEKIKFTFGAYMALNNAINVTYDAACYNYVLTGLGQEKLTDTVFYLPNQRGNMNFPLEQGIGLGFKKGERLSVAADFAVTRWKSFKFLDNVNNYNDNKRYAIGFNYVPEKDPAGNGALFRRINYRFGVNYNTGYIKLANGSPVVNYGISAGLGIPVGINRKTAMVNVTAIYGKTGPTDNSSIRENYWRISFGFTFNDRWFIKYLEN